MRVPRLSALTPRQLLAVDAAGAAMTAVTTALVLPALFGALGLPPWFFVSFGAAATALCLVSTVSALGSRHRERLRLVALGNLAYVTASLVVTATAWATVSPLWLGYLVFETVVMLTLVRIEWRAASNGVPA
ncbi:MAG: hypothetical protein MUC96_33755 [Myxococcaceae bacterium]|jgi:hypothetical protein|nr:hypothetical protein [Myxococcaceae bacterium]